MQDSSCEDPGSSPPNQSVALPRESILSGVLRKNNVAECDVPKSKSILKNKTTMLITMDPDTPFSKYVENAQRLVNSMVQYGYDYTVESHVRFIATRTTVTLKNGIFKYVIVCDGLRNVKEVNQFVNVAILVAMKKYLLYDVKRYTQPQGPPETTNTTNPEDIVNQTEISQQSENTEITQAVDTASAPFLLTTHVLQHQSTTEPKISLNELTERYIVIANGVLTSGDTRGQVKFSLDLPAAIYGNLDSSTSTALRPFTLMKTDLEITLKINSNQAQAGRYVLASYPCRRQAFGVADSVFQQIQREHVEVDVSTSADAILQIKYENLRNFMPILTNEVGETTGESFTTLTLTCLSPVNVVAGAVDVVPYQVIARFVNPFLTGMRYPLPVQGQGPEFPISTTRTREKVIETVRDVNNVLGAIPVFGALYKTVMLAGASAVTSVTRFVAPEPYTKVLEDTLVYVGMRNKDKPVDTRPYSVLQPVSQKALCHGLGPIGATKMRLEMSVNTPHLPDMETVQTSESYSELAQIGGVQEIFTVSTTTPNGRLLIDLPVAPFDARYLPNTVISGTGEGASRVLPPVTYISQLFQGYTGELEYEFIPVKTAAHNFSILVAFVPFDGEPGNTTFAQALSCHYKIIDFRTNSAGVFTVPFVSNSMFRSYTGTESSFMFARNLNTTTYTSPTIGGGLTVGPFAAWKDPGKVSVFMLNPLNPTPIVAPEIEIIVKLRGAKNIQFTIPSQPRFRTAYTTDSYVFAPIISGVTNANHWGTVPQGPVQTMNDDEVPGEPTVPLIGPQMTHMEMHDDILNVNRRLMHYARLTTDGLYYVDGSGATVYAPMSGSSACIPIVLSDPVFQNFGNNGQGSVNSQEMTPRNIRDATASLFRFGRGSVILSILNHSQNNLVISFLPPFQRPMYFSAENGTTTSVFSLGVARTSIGLSAPDSQGYASVRNVPSVNPVTDIEIPFYSSAVYMDLQARNGLGAALAIMGNSQSMARGPLYDVVTRTLGTLKIQTELYPFPATAENLARLQSTVTIRMGLSDDFKFHHFMGTPPVIANYPLVPSIGNVARTLTRAEIEDELIRAGIESNPGPVVKDVGTEPQGMWDFLNDLVSAPTELKRVREQGDYFKEVIGSLKEKIVRSFNISVTQAAALASTMLAAYMNPSPYTVVSAVTNLLVALNIVDDTFLMKVMLGCNEPQNVKGQGPLDDDKRESPNWIVPLLVSGFVEYCCSAMQKQDIALDPSNIDERTVFMKLTEALTGVNWFRVSAVMVVTSRLVMAFKWLFEKVQSWLRPSTSYLLLKHNPKFIENFMNDYTFIMNELNKNSIIGIRQCRDRFWTTLLSAYYLKGIMAKERIRNPTLLNTVNDIIKKANELTSILSAPPVRFEPFVVWIFGPRGVGKSTLLQQQLIDILEQHKGPGKFEHPNPVYTRNPTSQWWNGYNGQPIVLYDDIGAVSSAEIDPIVAGELMAIKSCAIMPLEKPRIEEKESLMTSVIVGIASNHPCLKSSVIRDVGAMDRRRDILARCEFTPEVEKYIKSKKLLNVASALPEEMTRNNKHLRYGVFKDPTKVRPNTQDVRVETSTEPDMWLTYDEFMEYSIDVFTRYYTKELEKMTKRYKDMLRLCPTYAKGLTDEASVRMAIMQMILKVEESKSTTTMDTLRYLIQKLEQTTPEYYKTLHKTTKEQLETINKVNTQPEGKFIIDKNKFDPGHWALSQVGGSRLVDYAKYIYDTLIPWHAPIYGKETVEFKDDTKCVFCKEKIDMVTYVCNTAKFNEHLACTCRAAAVVNDTNVVCVYCDTPMVPVFNRQPQSIYNWMAALLSAAKDVLYDPINSLPETWNKEKFRTNMRMLAISAVTALVMYTSINFADIVFKKSTYNAFYKYVGELPHKVLTVGEQVYLMTKSGVKFLLCRNQDTEFFIPAKDDVENAQGEFDVLPIEPGEIMDIELGGGSGFKVVGHSKKASRKAQKINREEFSKISDTASTSSDESDASAHKHEKHGVEFFSWLRVGEREKCQHDGAIIEKILRKRMSELSCTLDGKLVLYAVEEDETEIVLVVEKCCSACLLLDDRIVLKISDFFNQNSPIWKQHIDEGLLEYVPELYVKFLMECRNGANVERTVHNEKYSKWQNQILSQITTKFMEAVHVVWVFLTENYKMFLSGCAIIFCAYKGYKWYKNDEGIIEPVDPQGSYVSASQRTIRSGITRTINNSYLKGTQAHGPYLKEPNQAVLARAARIRKNYITMQLNSIPIWGIGLYGHTVLMTRHNWHWLKFAARTMNLDALTIMSRGSDNVVVKFSEVLEVLDLPEVEHVLIELPKKGLQCFSNIRTYFTKGLDEKGEATNPQLDELAYYIDVLDGLTLKSTAISAIGKGEPVQTTFTINSKTEDYLNSIPSQYDWIITPTQAKGMCLTAFLDKQGNILGFHVAGNARLRQGYVAPIFRELIPDAGIASVVTEPEGPSTENLTYMYSVIDAPYHTFQSKIVPSVLQSEAYDPEKEPCIQSRTDPRYTHGADPLTDGVATIGQPTKPLNDEILMLAYESVRDELLGVLPPPYVQPPVSIREAITAERAPISSSMNLATSAGYPLAGRGSREKKKSDYILGGQLKASVHNKINKAYVQRTNGIRPPCVYWAHLKDELRPSEKLRRFGGTRVFSVPPLELVLNSRRFLLPFMDAFQSFPIEAHHAIGLNPNSGDWRRLRDTLLEKGPCLLQMDYKNYSDAIPKECVAKAFHIIVDYYRKWHCSTVEIENALKTLFLDTADAELLVYGDVFKVNNGVLAGHPMTSVVNSVVNLILMNYMWIKITRRRASEFFKLTYIIVMGDDVVISLPKQLTEEFDCRKICAEFAKYDIKVTDSEKNLTGEPKPYDSFDKFEFLSRGFSDCDAYPDITFAPVKTIALFDCPLWISKGQDEEEQTIQAIQAGLLLAFDHGPEFFGKYKQLLLEGTSVPTYNYFTWSELYSLFHGDVYSSGEQSVQTNNEHGIVLKKIPMVLSYIYADSMCIGSDAEIGEEKGALEAQAMFQKKQLRAINISKQAEHYLTAAEDIYDSLDKVKNLEKWRCGCKYDCMREVERRMLEKVGKSMNALLEENAKEPLIEMLE
ncbi:polyprotein [Infectious flacherie virus]|uniref:Genome polyprotein n=1 Tax=Infectious flacherie virus (isolate Silkworm) TaxID=649896 RepID=O70710_IFVS|nr:polyprotein [Infectious flacherie virus]BAA25371.1 polyprotein [Infectious flacherie virus]